MKKLLLILLLSVVMLYGCTMQAEEATEEVVEEVIEEPIEEVAEPEPRDCEADGFIVETKTFEEGIMDDSPEVTIDYCVFGDGSACMLSSYEDSSCNHMQPLCKEDGWYWPEHYVFFPTELLEEELIMEADCMDKTPECKDDGWYVGDELLVEYDCTEKPVV